MTNRERIINTVLCREVDRLPLAFCFGPWVETLERWKKEGLQEDGDWEKELGLDPGFKVVDVNYGYYPAFNYKEIEDRSDTKIIRDQFGIVQEISKKSSTIPRYIKYPIKNMEDWEKIKRETVSKFV